MCIYLKMEYNIAEDEEYVPKGAANNDNNDKQSQLLIVFRVSLVGQQVTSNWIE